MLETIKEYKIRKENLYVIILISIGLILYTILKNANVLFLINISVGAWIVIKSKFSFFSIKTIIVNYILFSAFSQYNYNSSYGILALNNIKLYYLEMNLYILIYNVIVLIILINSQMLKNEKQLLEKRVIVSKISAYVCALIAIISTIIAMPTLPFLEQYNRFNAFLPGNAWNHIAIISLLFAFPKLKDSKLVKLSYLFVIFWFLAHYERVDVIGLIIAIIVLVCIKRVKIITLRKMIALRYMFLPCLCIYDLYWRV